MYKLYTLKDVKDASAKALFTFGDMFAGGGGASTGLKYAGGKELFMNEFVEEACETFKQNYPDVPYICDDIKVCNGDKFLQIGNTFKGDLDVISGSPPCSAFSIAGKGKKGWNKTKNYSDGKVVENIEDLFFEYLRIIDDIQPKIAICENVVGITGRDAMDYLSRVNNQFKKMGYDASHRILNAADYGIPQARERCIIIAVRSDVLDKLGMNFFDVQNLFPPRTTMDEAQQATIKDAIDDIQNDPEEVQMLLDFVMKKNKKGEDGFQSKVIPMLNFNPVDHEKPSDYIHRGWNPKGSFFNMIRPGILRPCPTLTQAGQQRGLSGILHYNQNRKLTIKEMQRIMSLPEDYILTGTFDQRAERICRMVAPIMYKHIGEHLYNTVIKPYKELMNNDQKERVASS